MNDAYQYLLFEVRGMRYAVSLEYVGYVISVSEQFSCCVPPGMPSYVRYVVNLVQRLVPIIDLDDFEGNKDADEEETPYPLILILSCRTVQVGLLVNGISLSPRGEETRTETDPVGRQTVVNICGSIYILLDVPAFYHKIKALQS